MSDTMDLKVLSNGIQKVVADSEKFVFRVEARHGYASSGTLYKPDLIVTSDHTVEMEEDIRVVDVNGKEHKAQLAGRDPRYDLAVLKLTEAVEMSLPKVADAPRAGELIVALARPTDDGVQASLGIVSLAQGRYRSWSGGIVEGVMRTDANRFPGSAGGPVFDVSGGLAGINVFGFGHTSPLTLPVATAWSLSEQLALHGSYKRGYLGFRSQPVDLADSKVLGRDQQTGLLVIDVEKASPAANAGLLQGDTVVGIADSIVEDHEELQSVLGGDTVGKELPLEVIRAGKREVLTVKVGEQNERRHGHSRHGHGRHEHHGRHGG